MKIYTTQSTNKVAEVTIIPTNNVRQDSNSIVPERFSSTSRPSSAPIVSPELGSVSKPTKPAEQQSQRFD